MTGGHYISVIDQPFSMFDECPKLDDVSFKNSTLSAYISKDSSSYEENKFYDYSDEYSGEVQLFDRRAKLSRLVTFDKIVGGSDWEKYPFVFLSGGLYRNEDSSDKKIYREITSDTKGGIVLNRLNDDEYKTVTFVDDKNKGEYTFDYQNNKKIDTIPVANTYKGRLFDGWYTEQIGGSEIGYSHVVSDDLTVYARFEGDDVQGDDWKEADSPWLKDYEYHLDGDNIVLDKNISFTYGNGLLIIPSAAYLNKKKYNVVLNLGEGFFCDDAKYASVVYFGESYKDALYSLKEAYYYDPMNNNFYFKNTASDFIESFKGEYPTWMTVENGDGYSTHNYISATGTAYGLFKNFGTEYYFLTNCDFYNVESCSAMFYGSGIKLLTKDTISIPYYADCSQMFEGCGNLTELMGLYISSSSCYRMFADCDSLEYVHDLQFGNDFSVQAAEMFEGCESLRQATILGPEEFSNIFDYKHPKISIYRMFSNCDNLTNVDLNYLTITDIDHAFWGCSQIHDVSFAHSDWEPYDNRYYDELMNRGSKTYYDLTDGNRVEYQIFDRTADVMYVENFESIEGDGFEPFIFLNGGIYRKSTYSNGHNTIDKSKYYRYLDSNTPANAYLETNWIHGSEDETCSITFDDGSKDYYYFRYLKGSKIDILPKPISYDEKQFNGWFTRIPYGKEIKVGQQIDANESAIAALQYPYEIKYNSEMPSFQNGAFSKDKYYVSDSKWNYLKTKLSKSEYNKLKKQYDIWKRKWFDNGASKGGICFGMSAAQITAHSGRYDLGKTINELSVYNKNDYEMLTLFHLGQYTASFLNSRKEMESIKDDELKLAMLVNRALNVKTEGPAMLVYKIGKGEHAIVIDGCEIGNYKVGGKYYKYKINVVNILAREGMEFSKEQIEANPLFGLPEHFDLYVADGYKYFTNASADEYGCAQQSGKNILAIYDDIDALNYFGTKKVSTGKKSGYNVISVVKGTISKVSDFLKKIGIISGTESDDDDSPYGDYFVDDFSKPVVIEPESDGVEFTYETQDKLVTFKSSANEPVSISYDEATDDYTIATKSGGSFELETVNNDGATFGVTITGETTEPGKDIEISTKGNLVYVNSDAEIKADLKVDEQENKVANINAKNISIEDTAAESKVEVKLGSDGDDNYNDRTIEVKYTGESVGSISDNGTTGSETGEEDPGQNSGKDDNKQSQDNKSNESDNADSQNSSEASVPAVDTTDNTVTEFTIKDAEYSVIADDEVKLTKYTNLKKKSITVGATVTYDGKEYRITAIGAKAFNKCAATKVTLGAETFTIASKAFKGSKVKNLVVKSGNMTKSSVKNALKGSSVTKITLKGAAKKKKKDYKKFLTKKNLGKSVTVK